MGTNRLRSGPDACRTMGLLSEMQGEAWRSLCLASALQVGIGQLNFNEVHSKMWSSVCGVIFFFKGGGGWKGEHVKRGLEGREEEEKEEGKLASS